MAQRKLFRTAILDDDFPQDPDSDPRGPNRVDRSVYVVEQCLADELVSVRLPVGRLLSAEMLGCFEHLDGSPCGVKEGE